MIWLLIQRLLILIALVISFFPLLLHAQVDDRSAAKPPYYEYLLGKRLSFSIGSLAARCSMLQGRISDMQGGNVTLAVVYTVPSGNHDENKIEIPYSKPRWDVGPPSLGGLADSPWRFVDTKVGTELMVLRCNGSSGGREFNFITSDQKLFSGVRKSFLHYVKFTKDPAILLKVPDLIKSDDDMFFVGYLVFSTASYGLFQNLDYGTLVLSQLLENDKIPQVETGDIVDELVGMLSGSSSAIFPITEATRHEALANVVKVASSKRGFSDDAVIILARIAESRLVDVKPYLISGDKTQIRKNLDAIPNNRLSQKPRQNFRALLDS